MELEGAYESGASPEGIPMGTGTGSEEILELYQTEFVIQFVLQYIPEEEREDMISGRNC